MEDPPKIKTDSLSAFLINATPESFSSVKFLDLDWKNLNVDVLDKKGQKEKTILKECTGYVKHGQMLSIMGPSGYLI